ncbi:hypothetical protein ACW9HQ_40975 [Nocardia gipuzkoensis]
MTFHVRNDESDTAARPVADSAVRRLATDLVALQKVLSDQTALLLGEPIRTPRTRHRCR